MQRMHESILQIMNNKKTLIFFIVCLLVAGVFIKCYYIDYTETWVRQHDVIGFGAEEGHAAYIEYILVNRHLPDFDPTTKWAFFQPPLHHIISAVVLGALYKSGVNEGVAQEITQVPTCIYMILLILVSFYMFLKAKGVVRINASNMKGKLITEGGVCFLAIVGLHPLFTLLSGSINNDALALILSLVALVIGYLWYEKPSIFRTVLLALTIGLAMVSKLTGGLVAVPIAMLMIIKFFGFDGGITSDGHAKVKLIDRITFFFSKYFAKAIVFAAIVFPLGLSFSIYNSLKWGMPFNYIPAVGENFPESVTMTKRLFDVSTGKVYTYLTTRGDAFDEYNVILAIIKTSLFGEYSFEEVSRWMKPLSIILFASGVILMGVALFATLYMLFSKKSKLSSQWKIILAGTYFTYLAAYLYFALSSNNFSAQDFRYAAICIVCEGIFIALFVDTVKNKKIKNAVMLTSLVFAASAFFTYALLGLKS